MKTVKVRLNEIFEVEGVRYMILKLPTPNSNTNEYGHYLTQVYTLNDLNEDKIIFHE